MPNSNQSVTFESLRKRNFVSGIIAIVIGWGAIFFDMTTGVLSRYFSDSSRMLMYVPLFLVSIWGLKQVLASYSKTEKNNALAARLTKNTFHLPIEGYGILIMMIVMFVAAMMGGSNMLLLVFSMLAGPFIINGWVTLTMLKKMAVVRTLPRRGMVGIPFSVEVTLENKKRLIPSFLMAVRDQLRSNKERIAANVLFARIPASQERKTPYQLTLVHRGRYVFESVEISTRFPLGFVERGCIIDVKDEIIIHPQTGQLSSGWKRKLSSTGEMTNQKMMRTGAMNDEFHHIREYRQGDDLRSIHWKTTARKNELMVREYRENRDRNMVVLLDLWLPSRPSQEQLARVENACSLVATIGAEQIRACGDTSLELIAVGKELVDWSAITKGNGLEGYFDEIAILEAGAAKQLPEALQQLQAKGAGHERVIIVSTRDDAENAYHQSDLTNSLNEWSYFMEEVQVIDANPEKTATFFQLT